MHRLRHVQMVLAASAKPTRIHFLACRSSSSQSDGKDTRNRVRIGNAERILKEAQNSHLVPIGYLPSQPNQTVLQHLKWMIQKDNLGQDIFLIGPPGSFRRMLTMMYLEMTNRECEYVALSRDTTENDLKQRREIMAGSAVYIDQSAVRAALNGRVLVLEGIEKAERNVLPVLNNLLENREMQLEDGRFLVAADRYDQLLSEHSADELTHWRLVRCDPDFRVIALGLPVPRYTGNSLDPPLRSRFQARDINNTASYQEILEAINIRYSNINSERLMNILSFAHGIAATEQETVESGGLTSGLQLPDFPMDRLHVGLDILNLYPEIPNETLISRLYPYRVILKEEGVSAVNELLSSFSLRNSNDTHSHPKIKAIDRVPSSPDIDKQFGAMYKVSLSSSSSDVELQMVGGSQKHDTAETRNFVETPYVEEQLSHLMLSHSVSVDVCLVGPRGCGKSALIQAFASKLNYSTESMLLHPEMTARDLLQQRATLSNGDTVWRISPLVNAALNGRLLVLDGLHRLNGATFSVLHRFLVDREADLFDGRRLLSADRYEILQRRNGWTDEEMNARGILRIHPAFRVVALSEPPPPDSTTWLSPDALTAFMFHEMRAMTKEEERHVIRNAVESLTAEKITPSLSAKLDTLLEFAQSLRSVSGTEHTDNALIPLAKHLSTRQLLRIARRMALYPELGTEMGNAVQKACLYRFLPKLSQRALDDSLETAGLPVTADESSTTEPIKCLYEDGNLRIGRTSFPLAKEIRNAVKIPNVRFYDNEEQLRVMETLMQDYMLGEHLLLIGNQGVGKNKIVDRLLYLMHLPREYMQLHRDTTVHSLTLQPTLKDGAIVYEDSPLVRAARLGHLLVIDEADKAPTQVTCILKTLVETGEMYLSDGRRIVPPSSGMSSDDSVLVSHPDFRMIVLANRPGFPFLGNDFFAALGDLFSCHSVDNPQLESEVAMLKKYGPDVPEDRLLQLVHLFSQLRTMADEGQLSYPYSTRELVSIIRHLQAFPKEGLASVVRNVFDFDAYSRETKDTLIEVLHKHGIPIGASPNNVRLVKTFPLPPLERVDEWTIAPLRRSGGATMQLSAAVTPLSVRGPVRLEQTTETLERKEARSRSFTEEASSVKLKMDEYSAVGDVALSSQYLHTILVNPISLYSIKLRPGGGIEERAKMVDLGEIYPPIGAAFRPRFRLAPLGSYGEKEHVLLHEEVTNLLMQIDTHGGQVWRLEGSEGSPMAERKLKRVTSLWPRSGDEQHAQSFKMCSSFSNPTDETEPIIPFYKHNGTELCIFHVFSETLHALSLPVNVIGLHMITPRNWLVEDVDGKRYFLSRHSLSSDTYTLRNIGTSGNSDTPFQHVLSSVVSPDLLPEATEGRIGLRKDTHIDVVLGNENGESMKLLSAPCNLTASQKKEGSDLVPIRHANTFLEKSSILARAVSEQRVPDEGRVKDVVNYLEVVNMAEKKLSYIPVTRRRASLPQSSWLRSACPEFFVRATVDEDVLTVDHSGAIRSWQVAPTRIDAALKAWKQMLGVEEGDAARNLMLEREFDPDFLSKLDDTVPKMGKLDPSGMPHVGGNTWAGGTGGRGTAGLGGVGGPFRLDAGHDVHQVSDEVKRAVPEHVRAAARDVALKTWRQRLKEIEMSEYDGEIYAKYLNKVQKQITSLRMVLDTLQAKGKERQWLKNKTEGELDDSKLIEGLIGEKSVYKRRGEKEPEPGAPQQKPKILRVVADVSGSMYRFNGHDGRLERQLESILMLMEAFQGYESRLKYEVFGHSGEGPMWPFVKLDKAPANNKERLNALMSLLAHSQFCASGDHTLEAVIEGIKSLKAIEEADERFLIILSDANLDRYGIHPKSLARLLTSEPKVNCYAIFIGTLGNQAQWLSRSLPAGHSFVCLDNKQLPQIMQQIFSSTILST